MFPKIVVPPKWMVYNGKPYFLMDDLGRKPTIFGNIHIYIYIYFIPNTLHIFQHLWTNPPIQNGKVWFFDGALIGRKILPKVKAIQGFMTVNFWGRTERHFIFPSKNQGSLKEWVHLARYSIFVAKKAPSATTGNFDRLRRGFIWRPGMRLRKSHALP